MKNNNPIVQKSKAFAIRIIRLYQHLTTEKREFILSKQVIRSGTSIGANVRESIRAQSTADFLAKMQISLKEADETQYWLELLKETDYISEKAADSLIADCEEIIRLIAAIVKTMKENQQQ